MADLSCGSQYDIDVANTSNWRRVVWHILVLPHFSMNLYDINMCCHIKKLLLFSTLIMSDDTLTWQYFSVIYDYFCSLLGMYFIVLGKFCTKLKKWSWNKRIALKIFKPYQLTQTRHCCGHAVLFTKCIRWSLRYNHHKRFSKEKWDKNWRK